MCTKTRNNRKKRSKRTNTTESSAVQRSHGNKTANQLHHASLVLLSFCFVSIPSLVSALLFWLLGVVLLLFWKPGFVSLLRVFVKIIYISFIITLKFGSSCLNLSIYSSVCYRVKFDGQKSKQTSFLIHDLRLGFREVWKVRFVINIIFIILKSLFDIGLAVVQVYLAGLIL